MKIKNIYIILCFVLFCTNSFSQDLAYNDTADESYHQAYELANTGLIV